MSARKFWSESLDEWVQRSSVRGVDFARRLIMRLGKHCEDVEPEIYIRGWLIERARTRRLRAELAEARSEAESMRDRFIDSEQDRDDTSGRYVEFGLPWELDG